ncbi:MAG: alpha/beta hydrolase family protein [Tunicatimonas sp.]
MKQAKKTTLPAWKRKFAIGLFCSLSLTVQAAHVDTVSINSAAMLRDIPALVITPDRYANDTAHYPTVYLLHGYSGNHLDWLNNAPGVEALADVHQMIIVCPDGGYNSWYLDSPVDDSSQYETHVAQEVVTFVDTHYRTIANRTGRAITGLSMGGHGALFLVLRHPDTFGAAGSMSGGVDLTYDTNAWEINEKLGRYEEHPLRWDSLSVVNLVALRPPDSLAMIIDCGTDDFFFAINQQLHRTLLEADIPHDYITRPGGHTWEYWRNAVEYQLLFFSEYFESR